MSPRIYVVSLYADDLKITAHFYRDVIGLRLLPSHGDRPHFDLGGSYLVLLPGKPALAQDANRLRFPVVAFRVDSLDAALDRLEKHGVELPWGVEQNEASRWVMFHDPAGNLIELVEVIDAQ